MLIISTKLFAQVGIGTTTPRGALDINKPTTNTLGLVLPTNTSTANIVNPQGGDLAEGTIIYDSQLKCVKVFDGNQWSNCLCDDCAPTTPPVAVDCSSLGFTGNFQSGTPLFGATYQVSITNNSLSPIGPITYQTSDLVLSGINGITVTSVSPTSGSLNPGQSQVITYNLSGTPFTDGPLTGSWSKINLSCSSTVNVGLGVRFAYWSSYSIGSGEQTIFNSQLQNPANYGSSGTYNAAFTGFSFSNITSTLSTLSVADLLARYDIICTGFGNMPVAEAAKIKAYVDGGGVAIILFDSGGNGTNLLNAFGGTGNLDSGTINATTNSNSINNGVFGNTTNITINGAGSYGNITTSQLPPGSTILAELTNSPKVFISGNDNRAIFFWDEGVFRNTSVNSNIIDTPQERFLHNIMAYALGKAGL
ncbi:hypothetical protein [Chryseobacterium sp. IHB B 17019]|uniref:hypothetical protein n=1 Tax=Chryseobacterium sp. IHB B 17019 TaxID=1721091 RepID=UPI0012378A95|nr:hypothetical protein [Chryseobacterium sp. IHB B 17019]